MHVIEVNNLTKDYGSGRGVFDVISIIINSTTFIYKFAILFVLGVIGYLVGSIKFKKKIYLYKNQLGYGVIHSLFFITIKYYLIFSIFVV